LDIDVVIEHIFRLKYLLSLPDTDVCWSNYSSADEVISDLEVLEKGIANRNKDAIGKLLYMLGPTASLQEISISSGWGREFLSIAEALETALGKRAI